MANLKSTSKSPDTRTGAAGTDGTLAAAAAGQTQRVAGGFLDPHMLWKSLPDALLKFDPRVQIKNPVMFVVEFGSVLTTFSAIEHPSIFAWTITVWLWLTVLFANLAEAVAEGRGKAQAATLRKTKTETTARRIASFEAGAKGRPGTRGVETQIPANELTLGDY